MLAPPQLLRAPSLSSPDLTLLPRYLGLDIYSDRLGIAFAASLPMSVSRLSTPLASPVELLFGVLPAYRLVLWRRNNILVISPGHTRLDLTHFVHGDDWVDEVR